MLYKNFKNVISLLQPNIILTQENLIDDPKNIDSFIDSDGYYIIKDYWNNNKSNGIDFNYRLNNFHFRSDHFQQLDTNKTNILYAGCSFTFGEGLPEELTWSYMLSNKISKLYGKEVQSYNLGYMGHSIDLNIKNIYSFINMFGIPDYIFICFPPISRHNIFSNKSQEYMVGIVSDRWKTEDPKLSGSEVDVQLEYNNNYQYENNIYTHSLLIRLLENFCLLNNIKLIWTNWHLEDNFLFKNLNFNNYIETDIDYFNTKTIKNINNLPYWSIGQDGAHPGSSWSEYLSNIFLKRIYND